MKVKKFFYSLFLILIASFFAFHPTLAITQEQLEEFAEIGNIFFDPEDVEIPDCKKTTVNLVSTNYGDQKMINAATVWNWFVNAGIPGVSDSAEVIAGIIGNLMHETSNINPFAWGGVEKDGYVHGRGIYKASGENQDFVDYVENLFGKDIWDKPLSSFDAETIKNAIEAELEYLVSPSHENWNKKGSGDDRNFVKRLDVPTYKSGEEGAAAYAELFMILVEIPHNPTTKDSESVFKIQDPAVNSLAASIFGDRYWSFGNEGGQPRRSYYAKMIYNEFAGNNFKTQCLTTIPDTEVTILTDGLVTGSNFISFSGASVYSGLTLYENTANKIADLNNSGDLRSNVVLAFDLDNVTNNEEELNDLISSLGSRTVYILTPTATTNTPTLALINSQNANKTNLNAINYNPNTSSSDIANIIINEFTSERVRDDNASEDTPVQPYTGDGIPLCPKGTNVVPTGYGQEQATLHPNEPAENYIGLWAGARVNGQLATIRLCSVPNTNGSATALTDTAKYTGTFFSHKRNGYVCIRTKTKACDTTKNIVYTVDVDPSKDAGLKFPNNAVFSSTIAGSMAGLINKLRELLNVNTLSTNSSLRTYEFQAAIHAMTPWPAASDSDCWNGWCGAGTAEGSKHVGGAALDLLYEVRDKNKQLIGGMVYYYNKEKQKPDSKLSQYLKSIQNEKVAGTCPSANFKFNATGIWKKEIINDFLCYLLDDYGLYFTIDNENWHIGAKN